MAKRRLLHQLYPSYLLITVASLVGVGWFAAHSVERFYLGRVQTELENRARYLAKKAGDDWNAERASALTDLCKTTSEASETRLTLLLPNGDPIADSEKKPLDSDNQANRPEVAQALRGEPATQTRFVPGLKQRVLFFALPVQSNGKLTGVVCASQPIGDVDQAISSIDVQIGIVGVLIAIMGALISLWISRQISRPIEEMRHGAERFARGDLDYKLMVPQSEELAGLANALNLMATQLQERIRIIVRQSNEQKAVVGSMVEGVLAVDNQERIISLNKATGQLLGIDQMQAQGRSLQEVVRNADLRRFIGRVLSSADPIDDDVVLHGPIEGVLQARGAALHDASGQAIGAVVVLNDVTEFRRLEHIRRDFVANVSHELKTPITSIKGFVETLLDGAVHDEVDAERFLRIVVKQADRLNAIIEDLLSLSKIEQGEDSGNIVLELGNIDAVLALAVQDCSQRAQDRGIQVQMACDDNLTSNINGPLLEQAIINLLDNAIKYSEAGREVQVLGSQTGNEVTITVLDRGSGISAEHLPRIFERFYRVDRARSRKLGGTGLGLAIVKHIVQAHGGRITVKSTLGDGSAFTIHLPRRMEPNAVPRSETPVSGTALAAGDSPAPC